MLLNKQVVDKIKLCLVNNELIYDITIDISSNFSATINLTSAYLGKSTYYGLYNIVETQDGGMFKIISHSGRGENSNGFNGTLIACLGAIFDEENYSVHPYEDYKYMYPPQWKDFHVTDVLCNKAFRVIL